MLNSASPFSSWKWATLREHAFCYYPMNTACEISLFHFGIQLNRLIWFSFYVVSSDLTSKSNEVDISASSWYFLALIFFFFLRNPVGIFFLNLFILFIYFWLCSVFTATRRLSLVAVNRGYSSLQCAGFSLSWLLLLRSTGSRLAGFSSCGTQAQ